MTRILFPLASALLLLAASSGSLANPPAVWDDLQRSSMPMNIEWLEPIVHRDVRIRPLRYTSTVFQGQEQRVYALFATPPGVGPFPAILQIHGGGQTAYPENVAWFVEHGYACLAFDWTGPREERPPEQVSQFSEPVIGNYFGRDEEPPQACLIYHATQAALRGIDVLAQQPSVAADRIGIQGVSWGGFVSWLVNGLDPRVRAAVAVYGIGDLDQHFNDMGTALRQMPPARLKTWRACFDPASFVDRQHSPIMFLNGANDFFGPLDIAERRLAEVSVPHARSYSVNRMHSLDVASVKAGMAWLDAHLGRRDRFPDEPRLTFRVGETGRLIGQVTVDERMPVERVRVDFARGFSLPLLRGWLSTDAQKNDAGQWESALPLVETTQPLYAIGQAIYRDGVMISTPMAEMVPARDLPGVRATELAGDIISGWGAPQGGWFVQRGVDFSHARSAYPYLETRDVGGRTALAVATESPGATAHVATRLVVDPACRKGNNDALELWVHDVARLRLRTNYFLREPNALEHEASRSAGPGWQRLLIALSEFNEFDEDTSAADPDGTPLPHWNSVHQLDLLVEPVEGGVLAVGQLRWAAAE